MPQAVAEQGLAAGPALPRKEGTAKALEHIGAGGQLALQQPACAMEDARAPRGQPSAGARA